MVQKQMKTNLFPQLEQLSAVSISHAALPTCESLNGTSTIEVDMNTLPLKIAAVCP